VAKLPSELRSWSVMHRSFFSRGETRVGSFEVQRKGEIGAEWRKKCGRVKEGRASD